MTVHLQQCSLRRKKSLSDEDISKSFLAHTGLTLLETYYKACKFAYFDAKGRCFRVEYQLEKKYLYQNDADMCVCAVYHRPSLSVPFYKLRI